jgi:hypothetical protein
MAPWWARHLTSRNRLRSRATRSEERHVAAQEIEDAEDEVAELVRLAPKDERVWALAVVEANAAKAHAFVPRATEKRQSHFRSSIGAGIPGSPRGREGCSPRA